MTEKIPSIGFDAAGLPTSQQFSAWAEFAAPYEVTNHTVGKGFVSVSTAWMLGQMVLNISTLGPMTMWRSPAKIRADNADHYVMVMLLEGGWSGDVDGKSIEMGIDDICMLDLTRPSDCRGHGCTAITLLIPRQFLDDAVAPFDVHGLVLDGGSALLFSDYMKALVARMPEIDTVDATVVALATRDHLAATLTTIRRRLAPKSHSAVLARAKRYIAINLDADLSPAALATQLGSSRSTLFRAFAELGGISAYVQERRLARAYALLSRPDEVRSVAEIAFFVGFKSHAHFSRLFSRTYGQTPSQLQDRPINSEPNVPLGPDPQSTYSKWGKRLL
ncbi:MAG: transcriptional regulator [Devosia sp.]|nr:transcriptional regulator [Devosia sp.]